jgi:hypothetical protein
VSVGGALGERVGEWSCEGLAQFHSIFHFCPGCLAPDDAVRGIRSRVSIRLSSAFAALKQGKASSFCSIEPAFMSSDQLRSIAAFQSQFVSPAESESFDRM